ncbi:MAG: ATPase domain-containing protein [Thermosphaera sp.]
MFEIGIPGIEELLRDAFKPGTLMLITGYPGAGKTTFATQICHANALKGLKTIYYSFQEEKSKYYAMMSKYGMDLLSLEKKGLFKYVSMPLIKRVEDLIKEISASVSENPNIIVLDSINPLIESFEKDIDRRAFIRNFFAELARNIDGIVILIGEIPFGERTLYFGGIEFTADVVVNLKYRFERGLLVRHLELRKLRHSPLFISEIPISIREMVGVEGWIPPVLSTIDHTLAKPFDLPSKLLSSVVENLRPSEHLFISHPPENEDPFVFVFILSTLFLNKARAVMITYKRSPQSLKMWMKRTISREMPALHKLIEGLDNYLIIHGINPYSYSATQLIALETQLVRKNKPDVVIYHGVELPYYVINRDEYVSLIYNEINYHRLEGRLVIRIGGIIDEEFYKVNSTLADVIMKFDFDKEQGKPETKLLIIRKGLSPREFTPSELEQIISEINNALSK